MIPWSIGCAHLLSLQVFAAYVMCTGQDKDAVRLALEQIDVILRLCSEYPDLELVTSSEGIVGLYA